MNSQSFEPLSSKVLIQKIWQVRSSNLECSGTLPKVDRPGFRCESLMFWILNFRFLLQYTLCTQCTLIKNFSQKWFSSKSEPVPLSRKSVNNTLKLLIVRDAH